MKISPLAYQKDVTPVLIALAVAILQIQTIAKPQGDGVFHELAADPMADPLAELINGEKELSLPTAQTV